MVTGWCWACTQMLNMKCSTWSWKYKSKLMPAMKEKCKRDGLVEHDTKHHCFKYVFFKHCWLVTRKIGKYLSTQYILLIILFFFERSIAVCHWWMVNVMALLLFSQGFCCVCFPFKITEKKDIKFNGKQIRFLSIYYQRHFYYWFSSASFSQ